MFDCITGLAWWQPLGVPSHQRQKVHINTLLLIDLSCELLSESDWNSMFPNVAIQRESAVVYPAKEVP